MDRLPLEVVENIVDHVVADTRKEERGVVDKNQDKRSLDRNVNGPLAGLATLSCKFQSAVEAHLFSYLEVHSSEMDSFKRIMVRRRRVHLKSILYVVTFHGRRADHDANEAAFRAATSQLFEVLASWEEEEYTHAHLRSSSIHINIKVRHGHSPRTAAGRGVESQIIIARLFNFPFCAEYPHPSFFLESEPGAPFRSFGVNDGTGTALWKAVSGTFVQIPHSSYKVSLGLP
jgi:hypothetical protein